MPLDQFGAAAECDVYPDVACDMGDISDGNDVYVLESEDQGEVLLLAYGQQDGYGQPDSGQPVDDDEDSM